MFRSIIAAAGVACIAGVSSAQVPGHPNLYQSVAFESCDNADGDCTLVFDRIPADRTLKVTNINCTGGIEGSPTHAALSLFSGTLSVDTIINDFVVAPVASGTGRFGLNEAVQSYLPGGRRPKVRVVGTLAGAAVSAICSLSGQLLNPQE